MTEQSCGIVRNLKAVKPPIRCNAVLTTICASSLIFGTGTPFFLQIMLPHKLRGYSPCTLSYVIVPFPFHLFFLKQLLGLFE